MNLTDRVPVQGDGSYWLRDGDPRKLGSHSPGTITWAEHLKAYETYSARYGTEQSALQLVERSGFSYDELVTYLGHDPRTWEPI